MAFDIWLAPSSIHCRLLYFIWSTISALIAGQQLVSRRWSMDKYDADAKRLVEIFQSVDANRVLVRVAILLSVALFIIMALVAFIFRSSLNWSLVSPWQAYGLVGGCIGSLLVIGTQYVVWGLKTWAAE
jgi:nitrate/nitrite-specific signal transduction histidine kinase